jgi:threonine/homoserine/homoserine lactone efflux protein
MTIAFLITPLIVCVSPGTGVLYTLGTGLSRGFRASVVAALGCTLGNCPHIAAAIHGAGRGAARERNGLSGVQIHRRRLSLVHGLEDAARARRVEGRATDRSAFRSSGDRNRCRDQSSQPELSIFFMAFLPQFIGANEAHPLLQMLGSSGVFMMMTFVIFVGYGLFAASIRDHVISRPRVLTWMRRAFAGAFVALGAKLAFAER